jgi:hypothetical protein
MIDLCHGHSLRNNESLYIENLLSNSMMIYYNIVEYQLTPHFYLFYPSDNLTHHKLINYMYLRMKKRKQCIFD